MTYEKCRECSRLRGIYSDGTASDWMKIDSPFGKGAETMAVFVTCSECKLNPKAVDEIMTTEGPRPRRFWHSPPTR